MKKLIAMLLTLALCLCVLPVAAFAAPEGLSRLAVVGTGIPGIAEWDITDPAGDMTEVSEFVYTKTLYLTAGTEIRFKIAADNGMGGWNDAFNFGSAILTLGTVVEMENGGGTGDMSFKADKDTIFRITVNLNPLNEGGKATILIDYDVELGPIVPIVPPTPGEEDTDTGKKCILTVEAPESWPAVYAYTWDPESLGTFPGTQMQKISDNVYECEIDSTVNNLVLTNMAGAQTADLYIPTGVNVSILIRDDLSTTIRKPSNDRYPKPPYGEIERPLSEYRVTGNADWLGSWDPAFDGGRMYDMGDGVYRRIFEDVPPGSYELKITKDGKWDNAYGDNGQNVCFTVEQKCNITVDFRLNGDIGVIDIYGPAGGWDDGKDPEVEEPDWGLTLMADEITPTGMTVVMVQSGGNCDGDLEYGSAYHLEWLTEAGWERVPYLKDEVYWTMEAYGVPPESINRMKKDWEWLYGELPVGHYRYVKNFMDFRASGDYDEADFYAEFVITDAHDCVSGDGDFLCDICLGIASHECLDSNGETKCDICGKKTSDRDVFYVIGDGDWLGNWAMGSNLGLMTQIEPGVYQAIFRDVPPGSYDIQVAKNCNWLECWGGDGEFFSFTVDRQMDITISFTLKDEKGVISVLGPTVDGLEEVEDQEESADTGDLNFCLPIVLLLCCSAALGLLLNKRKRNAV